jgi:ABC-2 type transport system permease protein
MSTTSALVRKHTRHIMNVGRIIRSQSNFKWMVVLGFVVFFEGGLWFLFLDGFEFLNRFGGAGSVIISRLFSLFFLGMGMMLVVSSLVTAYSTVFRSEEIPFLLVRPFGVSEIVTYKFLESTMLSSWAFFFVILPFVGAYTWFEGLSPLFAIWTVVFSLPFLVLCSGLGTVIVLLCVRWLPRSRWVRRIGLWVLGVALIAAWVLSRHVYREAAAETFSIVRLVPGLRLASNMMAPSAWVAEGIMSLSAGRWGRGLLLWLTLCSSAAAVTAAVEWVGGLTFYEAWQRVTGSKSAGGGSPRIFGWLRGTLAGLPLDVRAMVLKDLRTFFRDPIQWSQALVFFGMLALYFGNLRSFRYHVLPDHWRNMIAFLNVFSVAAVVCSFGSRFVFPQLSLEGHGFWILGLSPTSLRRVVLTKFAVAVVALSTISVVLTFMSTSMLSLDWRSRLLATGIILAVSVAVCGLSTGLGAIYLDLEHRNPAAIVSGFGGTLNLVVGLAFMLVSIIPPGLCFHLYSLGKLSQGQLRTGVVVTGGWLLFITWVTAYVPMRIGMRSIERRDF